MAGAGSSTFFFAATTNNASMRFRSGSSDSRRAAYHIMSALLHGSMALPVHIAIRIQHTTTQALRYLVQQYDRLNDFFFLLPPTVFWSNFDSMLLPATNIRP